MKPETLPRGLRRRGSSLYCYLTHPDGNYELRRVGKVAVSFAATQRGVWQREIDEGRYVKKLKPVERLSFEVIASRYLEHARNYHRFWDSTSSRVALMKSWWNGLAADEITTPMIDAKLLEMRAPDKLGWSECTSNEYRGTLYQIYRVAGLAVNPAAGAVRYKLNNARTRELSYAEEDRLRAAIRASYPEKECELDLALHTGLRFSNMYGSRGGKRRGMEPLQWDAVDLNWKVIQLPRSKAGRGYPVPLNKVALAALAVLRKRSVDETGPVIRKPSGLAIYSSRKWFAACCEKARIADLCWHDLRHTFGTRLRRNRIPLEDIKQLMGHALGADEITLRYAHADIDNLHEAVATLEHRTKTVHSTISEISSKRSA